jgi:hypothetical protein
MALLRIYQSKSKPGKKKPGWQQAEAEYQAWLAKVNSQTLFNPAAKPKMRPTKKVIDPVVKGPVIDPARTQKLPSLNTPGGAGTKAVHRPEIVYKDNPELLERELLARQRKFNVAPAYNKGADQLVTEEQLQSLLSSNKRRS